MSQSTSRIVPSSAGVAEPGIAQSWIVKYGLAFGRRYPHGTAVIHLLAGIWLVALGAGLVGWGNRWGWALVGVAAAHFWLGYLWERSTKR
jgi:hypothetical protein